MEQRRQFQKAPVDRFELNLRWKWQAKEIEVKRHTPNRLRPDNDAKRDDLQRLRLRSIAKLGDDAALNHIGALIDASEDAGLPQGAERAIYLLDKFSERDLDVTHAAILEYSRVGCSF